MIITLALNPAIDKELLIDEFETGKENYIIDQRVDIGGSGINAAKTIKILQGEPYVIGFLGGLYGRYIKSHLDKSRIRSDFIWTNGETGMNATIIDPVKGTKTTFYDKGIEIQKKEELHLLQKVQNLGKDSSAIVLGDSIPNGISHSFYYDVIQMSKNMNTKTILAAKGEELISGIEAGPYGLKLSKAQLKDLGIKSNEQEEVIEDLIKLLEKGIHYIALDLGKEGGYILSKSKICYLEPPDIDPVNMAGATDAFLGALAVGIERKYEQERFSKLAVACSMASMICTDTAFCRKADVDLFAKKVKIRELRNKTIGIFRK